MESRHPEQLASISRSLEVIAQRAIQTGRGPASVLASVRQRQAGDAVERAREIAAELAPRLASRFAARAESVLARDTVVG